MFTGIVKALGKVTKIVNGADSAQLTIESPGFLATSSWVIRFQ